MGSRSRRRGKVPSEKAIIIGRILDNKKELFSTNIDGYLKLGKQLERMNTKQLRKKLNKKF